MAKDFSHDPHLRVNRQWAGWAGMRVDWEIPTGKDQSMFVAVDVTNVTDRVNSITSTSGSTTYEVGRQYWLEVGYRF